MGMGHPIIRRMFTELGERFVAGGAIQTADDIYWLEEGEVEDLITALEKGQPLQDFARHVSTHKAEWRAALQIVPLPRTGLTVSGPGCCGWPMPIPATRVLKRRRANRNNFV